MLALPLTIGLPAHAFGQAPEVTAARLAAKAKKAGATIYVEYQEIPNMGSLAVFADPTGGAIGV